MMRSPAATVLGRTVANSVRRSNHASSMKAMASTVPNWTGKNSSEHFFYLGAGVITATFLLMECQGPKKTLLHCQVPCGIFDDPAMVSELQQAATTVRKAMVQSAALNDEQNKGNADTLLAINQVIRWVMTKEEHCDKIIRTISDYCLCQRVKRNLFANESEYLEALKAHHVAMQAAMRCKQSMDLASCQDLDEALDNLAKMYVK